VPEVQPLSKQLGRGLRRALLTLVGLVLALAAAGATYNALSVRYYRNAYPPPGKLYPVNGKMMHLYCTGEGSPTVVLESGLGNDWLIWGKVQPALSNVTRVCSYDRIGVGWSEEQLGGRDSNSVADRLHALLSEAGVGAPLVLMGHSIGGLHIRAFTARFPHDVVGLVFVDCVTPIEAANVPPELRALRHDADRDMAILKWQTFFGIPRIRGECLRVAPGFEHNATWLRADSCIPSQFDAILAEGAASEASGRETLGTGPFGDLPVLIFSSDPSLSPPNLPLSAEILKRMGSVRQAGQEDLKKLSTRSRRIIAKGSRHYIQMDRADLLNRECRATRRTAWSRTRQGVGRRAFVQHGGKGRRLA
jgi:pimeloyl-ACP methyl ester carboxylesterase